MSYRTRATAPGRQKGVTLVLLAIGLVAIIAAAGLALDGGHLILNKARLQNAVDSSALAGAKVLDQTLDVAMATQAARAVFGRNASAPGNDELGASWSGGDISLAVQYSETLDPFVPGAAQGPYVRVIATGYRLPAWLVRIVNINQFTIRASAVSGPSPRLVEYCDVAPILVCGDPAAGGPFWGYEPGDAIVMKTSSQQSEWEIGPGNFHLLRIGGSGANIVRENLAGGFNECLDAGTTTVETEPGNTVGPAAQGTNTRFGKYAGPVNRNEYPPDVITRQQNPDLTSDEFGNVWSGSTQVTHDNVESLLYTYRDYDRDRDDPSAWDHPPVEQGGDGVWDRRVLVVPIGDCTPVLNGQSTVDVLGFACFFLLQEVAQKGNEAEFYGQFMRECNASGTPGARPGSGPGPYIIQLYKDPDSTDS